MNVSCRAALDVNISQETQMEMVRNFNWAQGMIDELTGSTASERRRSQSRSPFETHIGENRAARRERERIARRAAKKKVAA